MSAAHPSPHTGRTVLVTGASAGIGAAAARAYARRGWNVALTARREAPMRVLAQELAAMGVEADVFPADLFEADAPAKILAQATSRFGAVDGLFNNAGYGHPGRFLDSPWEDHAKFLQLMLHAPTELAYRAGEGMAERGFGRIINVASLAGHLPGSKGHTLYAAVKGYLVKFSESLALELESSGVKVSALCPGFTYSEFHDVNDTRGQVSKLPGFMFETAERVVEEGLDACERGRAVFIPGRVNKTIATVARLVPSSVGQGLMRRNSEKFRKGN